MNQYSLLGDCCHDIVVDEVIDESSCRRFVDVCRRHSGGISILCDEFGFESLVIVSRPIESVLTSHGIHAWARSQARLARSGADKRSSR